MSAGNDELIVAFITEATEGLAGIENDFLLMEEAGENIDTDLVNKIFRAIHSMKGTSGFLGLKSIGLLAHEMENALNLIRSNELVPTSMVVEALLKGADALSAMIADIENSDDFDVGGHIDAIRAAISGEASEDVQEALNRDVDVELPDGGGLVFMLICEQELVSRQKRGCHIYVVDADLIGDVHDKGRTPLDFLRDLYDAGELIDSYVSTAGVGGLSDALPEKLSLMNLVASELPAEKLAEQLQIPAAQVYHIAAPEQYNWSSGQPEFVAEALIPTGVTPAPAPAGQQTPASEPTPAPNTQSIPEKVRQPQPAAEDTLGAGTKAVSASASLRVNVQLLDTLMNLAGELVLGRNQLVQIMDTADRAGLESAGARIDQITSELQEAIMQTRMQPIGSVFTKFPRVVRDLSKNLGKECNLTMEGKDVELDKSIVEAIGDPLTHLVRNSVDHGVEIPNVRQEKGKPVCGSIILRAFHQAGKVLISITDDGAGIDAEKLRRKAVDKGLFTPEQVRAMSDRDAVGLIFHPGFSTAEVVTDVSGRGVGMDVVKTNIEGLGGTVEIDTEIGKGTTIIVKLPLTLAIIPSLVVFCGGNRYAIPQVNISELVRIKPSEVKTRIQKVKHAEVLRLRGALLPLVRLSGVLQNKSKYFDALDEESKDDKRENITDVRTAADKLEIIKEGGELERRGDTAAGALNIIVVEAGQVRYGLIVDALHDSEEIVVKPLGRHMKESECLAGATILGDGTVALILDIAGIATYSELVTSDIDSEDLEKGAARGTEEMQSVLVFTNHPQEQFAVPMALIARIERIKKEQIDTVGGQAVLQYRGESLSLLHLDDCIKAKAMVDCEKLYVVVFSIAGKEIGLVAPQLVDIRDVSSEIDTVTFREPGVSGSLIVEDKATRLIDIFELADTAHPEWFARREEVVQDEEGRLPLILLAEDSTFFREQTIKFVEAGGYEVLGAEDGVEAWNILQDPEKKFDLVITDIEMPNMDGLELTRKIKGDPMFAHLPVIAVTSLAGEDDIEKGMRSGVDDYQVKLDREKLLASIARWLKEAKSRAGIKAGAKVTS